MDKIDFFNVIVPIRPLKDDGLRSSFTERNNNVNGLLNFFVRHKMGNEKQGRMHRCTDIMDNERGTEDSNDERFLHGAEATNNSSYNALNEGVVTINWLHGLVRGL